MNRSCAIDACAKSAGVRGTAKGFCSMHYNRLRRTGDPLLTLTDLKPKASPLCSVAGCEKARWARGFCPMHLYRWRKWGDPGGSDALLKTAAGSCNVDGCDRPADNGIRQLCKPHYLRLLRHGDPQGGAKSPRRGAVCSAAGCDDPHYARGLCRRHWGRVTGPERNRRRRDAPGQSPTSAQVLARIAYFGWRCWICRAPFQQVDHVKPIAAGGAKWASNLRPVCASCNAHKSWKWFGPRRLRELVA